MREPISDEVRAYMRGLSAKAAAVRAKFSKKKKRQLAQIAARARWAKPKKRAA